LQKDFLIIMKKYLLWLCVLFCCGKTLAHPMPSSTVDLSVLENFIRGEAKIPLIELGNAVGEQRTANMADPFFKSYFSDHIKATSNNNSWTTQIDNIHIVTGNDPLIGTYKEVVVRFMLTPADNRALRTFTFNYDAVIHQVVTHSALVYVQQDWDNGLQGDNSAQQIGVIHMDVPTGKIFPLEVNLEEGSWWKGFRSMLNLGMQHIKEGTDHLLFLIVLLLPAMLLTNGNQWGKYAGLRYSITHLLKIITAFTIGHSITLLVGALGWVKLPGQPVEIMIAVSILVSAVHAMRPIFPGKETFIAAGFGLIHGLAFATVLSNLELSGSRLALSVLGFNAGIEVMQLFLIAMIVPWLILLSKTPAYKWFRIIGAALAAIAAVAWIGQRTSGTANYVTGFVEDAATYGVWIIAGLAIVSLAAYIARLFSDKKRGLIS
jgi:HupE / UreJ protein